MQAQAYEGYFEDGKFYSAGQPLRIPERRKVYITVLDELTYDTKDISTEWVDELECMVNADTSEKLDMKNFPRLDFGREPVIFADEG